MAHYITNKGALALMNGAFAEESTWKVILLNGTTTPAAMDTLAEIADINFVADLVALTGVDECSGTGYARKAITPAAMEEDETNNRVNLPVDASVTWTGANFGSAFAAAFILDTGNDATSTVISIDIFASAVTTNGGDLTYTMTDVYRATPA